MVKAHSPVQPIPSEGIVAALTAVEVSAHSLTMIAAVTVYAAGGGPQIALSAAWPLSGVALATVNLTMAPREGPAGQVMVEGLNIESADIIVTSAVFAVTISAIDRPSQAPVKTSPCLNSALDIFVTIHALRCWRSLKAYMAAVTLIITIERCVRRGEGLSRSRDVGGEQRREEAKEHAQPRENTCAKKIEGILG